MAPLSWASAVGSKPAAGPPKAAPKPAADPAAPPAPSPPAANGDEKPTAADAKAPALPNGGAPAPPPSAAAAARGGGGSSSVASTRKEFTQQYEPAPNEDKSYEWIGLFIERYAVVH